MIRLQLDMEPFAPGGNLSAEGVVNLLGAPSMGLLSVLVREALQNVCDAIDEKTGDGAEVRVRLRKLSDEQTVTLIETGLGGRLPPGDCSPHLRSAVKRWRKQGLWVLEIADYGTVGLGGPVRADVAVQPGERPDFINFLRNVGAIRDVALGGGTYGYGKACFYRASRAALLLVDSVTRYRDRDERRLMFSHLGRQWQNKARRYTGRCWWGVPGTDGTVDPLTGAAAKDLATALDLPRRSRTEYGTTILVIDPWFVTGGDENASFLDRYILNPVEEKILWWFWPRMLSTTPEARRLRVRLWREGRWESIPVPEDLNPLRMFARALELIRKPRIGGRNRDEEVYTIRSERPKKHLGHLAIVRGPRGRRRWLVAPPPLDDSRQEDDGEPYSVFPERAHHVALMRPAGFVVKYLEGPALPDDDQEWAGVFCCSEEQDVEQAFARSEPPAHDDWCPKNLPPGNERRYVNIALKKVGRAMKQISSPEVHPDTGNRPLARLAEMLGSLIPPASPEGAGGTGGGAGGKAGQQRRSVSVPRFVRLEVLGSDPVAVFDFEVRSKGPVALRAEPRIIVDGRPEEPDESIGRSRVLEWRDVKGSTVEKETFQATVTPGTWQVVVSLPSRAAVTVYVTVADPLHDAQ